MLNPIKLDKPLTIKLFACTSSKIISFCVKIFPPTYKSPPVVVIPPAAARVIATPTGGPVTDNPPPTFKFLSIPIPPCDMIDPVSVSFESSKLLTNIASFKVIVFEADSKIKLPLVVSILFPSITILSTFTLKNVPTPAANKSFVVVNPVTFNLVLTVATPILACSISDTFISASVIVATPDTSTSTKLFCIVVIFADLISSVAVKIPVTIAPVETVSNRLTLLKFNSTALPAINFASVLFPPSL